MQNHYHQLGDLLFKTFIGAAIFLFSFQSFSQIQVNLNKTGSNPDIEINLSEKANIPFFAKAKRARSFDLNSTIANIQELEKGNKIQLHLFNNKDFPSSIVSKITDINGITTVTLKMDDFDYAFGYIVVSRDSYLITIDIPELKEKYTTRRNKETNSDFILLLDESKMDKVEECEPLLLNDNGQNQNTQPISKYGETENYKFSAASTSNDPATIDIMIVYTPLARDWSDTNDQGINNTIATAMATANTVSSNSELGINFNLIYSGLVDYTEQNNGTDLSALRINGDGLLDEVHDIRKNVGADMVVLFTNSSGGVAYLLNNKLGQTDTAFSLTGIGSAKSLTFPHELGHNIGIGHYKYQLTQPGNTNWVNWPENTWSGGWRWESTDLNMYGDVMTYTSGDQYDDGITTIRTPYFSDPNHIYIGAIAGNEIEGNGTRTLKEMKHIIGDYSNSIAFCPASAGSLSTLFINKISMGGISNNSSQSGYANYSSTIIPILPQETQSLQIEVSGYGSKKQVLVWIDWNDDKIFDPVTELEYTSFGNHTLYTTEITAPLGVEAGKKRMRIRLQDLDSDGNIDPCGTTQQGEVEDYTINLEADLPCETALVPQNPVAFKIENNHYSLSWDKVVGVNSYELHFRKVGTENWSTVSNIVYPFYTLSGLEESTTYEAKMRSLCSSVPSEFSPPIYTMTDTAATGIAFVNQPMETQEGRTIPAVSVELLDELGSRKISTAEVTIHLIDNASTGATLSGTLTVAAIDGLATFSDLKIDMTGIYSLGSTQGSIQAVVSNSFNILPFEQRYYSVTSTGNDGAGSLREAIELANESDHKDIITFNIEGAGPHRIILLENLPPITQKIELDATVQPGYNPGSPQIIIDGSNVPRIPGEPSYDLVPKAFYLTGNSSGSMIKGFVIGSFGAMEEPETGIMQNYFGAGIIIQGTGAHTIQANFIGVSANGTDTFSNYDGIYLLGGTDNIIGGTATEERNVISGNRKGLALYSTSINNQIQGNYIGISSDGQFEVANDYGIFVLHQAIENFIIGNTISGNMTGTYFTGSSNSVLNNNIGTDPTGNFAIPNDYGMVIYSDSNTIGAIGQGNLISGNLKNGISLLDGSHNQIVSNLIGTDKTGNISISNEIGIHFSSGENINNRVGGVSQGEGNIISGNLIHGIQTTNAHNNLIYGNYIGISKDGLPLGNGGDGIHLYASHNTVVGGGEEKDNTIAFNTGAGVAIVEFGNKNLISQNKIFSNSSMGIDLGNDGITLNDRDDADYNNNEFQNFPELKNSASLEGGFLNLEYLISSSPQYAAFPILVEFFKSDGNRQGKEYLGSDVFYESNIQKGKKGKMISLQLVPGNTLNGGDKILATATDANGNTSEFGAEVDVTGGCAEITWYADKDGDSLGDLNDFQSSCTQPIGFVTNSDDCDDTNPDIGAGSLWYADVDGDTFGDPNVSQTVCNQPDGYVANSDDCDDSDVTINPNATDVCLDCDTSNDIDCGAPAECLGTDTLTLSEICTDAANVYWMINNPGSCSVEVRWESRKTMESGILIVPTGDVFFSTGISSRGPTQISIYWPDSSGTDIKTSINASGIACTSSDELAVGNSNESRADTDPAVNVYPNPVTSEGIWLHFSERNKKAQFKIVAYDLTGLKMAETIITIDVTGKDFLWEIDHSRWMQRIYLLNVSSGNEIYQIKIIK